MSENKTIHFSDLSKIAKGLGLNVLGCSLVNDAYSQQNYLEQWQDKGYQADLDYMHYQSDLFCNPSELLPELKSIIVFSVNYSYQPLADLPAGYGRVARYAWGKDYHKVLKKKLQKLIKAIQAKLKYNLQYRIFSDAVPFLERYFAAQSGLGFVGKNTMLISPGKGSYSLLAEVLWDLEVLDPSLKIINNDCGSCKRCLEACPTNALVEEYKLDANKCISYLTIEKRGDFNEWERQALGEWVFGCDLCQEICPFNYQSLKKEKPSDLEEFEDVIIPQGILDLKEVLAIRTDQEFRLRFQSSPLLRTKRQGLLRNACAVAVNTGTKKLLPELEACYKSDTDSLIQRHAGLALEALS